MIFRDAVTAKVRNGADLILLQVYLVVESTYAQLPENLNQVDLMEQPLFCLIKDAISNCIFALTAEVKARTATR